MKKYISILLSLLILFSLTACVNNQAENKEPTAINKNDEPISTSKALESDGFEFIYNLEDIPKSFWNEENSLKCKNNFEYEVMPYGLGLSAKTFDFKTDIDATNYSGNDEYYELVFNNNNFLIAEYMRPFNMADTNISMYVMGNNLEFYNLTLLFQRADDPTLEGIQLENSKWNYVKVEYGYSYSIKYIYKINDDRCLSLHVGNLNKLTEDPYTEDQLKELGEYVTSLLSINKVDKKDLLSLRLSGDITLDKNYYLDLDDMKIAKYTLNEDSTAYTVPCLEIFTEDGEEKTFMEFDSEESFNKWKGSLELEPYDEHVSLLKFDEQSFYDGYQGLCLKYDGKYYALFTFGSSGNISDKAEYVNSLMSGVIFKK